MSNYMIILAITTKKTNKNQTLYQNQDSQEVRLKEVPANQLTLSYKPHKEPVVAH